MSASDSSQESHHQSMACPSQTPEIADSRQLLGPQLHGLPREELTENEEDLLLAKCENRIAIGLGGYFDAGIALLIVRERKLYKRRGYASFEDYCRARWDISRFYAYRLINAVSVAKLLTHVNTPPTTEAQVRPLVNVNPDLLPTIWEQVVSRAKGSVITSTLVRSVVSEFFLEQGSSPISDSEAKRTHPHHWSIFERVLTAIEKTKLFIDQGYKEEAIRELTAIELALDHLRQKSISRAYCCERSNTEGDTTATNPALGEPERTGVPQHLQNKRRLRRGLHRRAGSACG